MLHLLKIDLKKLTSYRTFWIVCGLYFLTLGFGAASGMELLKLLANTFEKFGQELNINRIPLYHFPDVWMNLVWFSGLIKIVLAIMVVISITNEYTYRTLRQNIIDGMSRSQFLLSKILTNVLLSLMSVAMIFVVGLVTGMIYSPEIRISQMLTDLEFFPAYFLEIFFFLSYALMLGILIQRSGLTIILLLLSQMVETIITANIDNYVPWLIPYFPMKSIWNLIEFPLPRYAFQEIKDYITFGTVVTVIAWTLVFNYISYFKLKRADI
ncbi:ABC transporter permease subunit [Chryseolinea sp. H1M3-3]|uniref:ABC transporter permease subunit n=1 Tax=Chryseolinea sp. H1M3-3 TaxID=3034144 RepID=UPI0023EB2251|nr:ABC transporter permease subunit [Chryseolinea sp. H1M3-3]